MGGFLGSCGWLWIVLGSCGWLWLVADGCGWFFGWLWMVVRGFGWLWVVTYFSITNFQFLHEIVCVREHNLCLPNSFYGRK